MVVKATKFYHKNQLLICLGTIVFIAICMLVSIALIACINSEVSFAIPESPEYDADRLVTTTKLTTYEGPSVMKTSENIQVQAEGHDLFVYETRINNKRSFSFSQPSTMGYVVSFDFEGSINLTVVIPDSKNLCDVVVRPLAYNINTFVINNKVIFKLDYPADYTLEYKNSDDSQAQSNTLHIFANELEINPVDESNVPDDTIYIGPGVYDASAIPIKSGQTLYLAGGAYLYGQIRAEFAENITIRGRGIISGSIYDKSEMVLSVIPIEFADSRNITINGVTILDPAGMAIVFIRCVYSNIKGVNIITARANSDGISLQSCVNINVSDSFIRTWADSLVVKDKYGDSSENIVFENCVVWTDLYESCKVGYETNGAHIKNVTFRDITILHNFHKAVMAVHNADQAFISDIYFLNITIEDAQTIGELSNTNTDDFIIDVEIAKYDSFSVTASRGPINNVTFSNINILETVNTAAIRLTGEDTTAALNTAIFNNVYISYSQVKSTEDASFNTNNYINDVLFGSQGPYTNGARIKYPYILKISNSNITYKEIKTKKQNGVEVPAFAITNSTATFAGDKINIDNASVDITHNAGFDHVSYDDGSWTISKNSINNLFDDSLNTKWTAPAWTSQSNEYAAISITFYEIIKPGIIRVYLDSTNKYSIEYRIRIYNKSADDKGFLFMAEKYCKTSPANANYFDIMIPKTESHTLQLRIYEGSGILGASSLVISEIMIFPLSLTTNQPILNSPSTNGVYISEYVTDGNINTYWEAEYENEVIIIPFSDDDSLYNVTDIVLHLPPSQIWDARYQTISIRFSTDGINFYKYFPDESYYFDPSGGNFVRIQLESPVLASYILIEILETNTQYGAQLSEVFVYGPQQ